MLSVLEGTSKTGTRWQKRGTSSRKSKIGLPAPKEKQCDSDQKLVKLRKHWNMYHTKLKIKNHGKTIGNSVVYKLIASSYSQVSNCQQFIFWTEQLQALAAPQPPHAPELHFGYKTECFQLFPKKRRCHTLVKLKK